MKKILNKSIIFILLSALLITYLPLISVADTIYSDVKEWDGRYELESGIYYTLNREVRLNSDFTVPEGAALSIIDDGALILRNEMNLFIYGEILIGMKARIDMQKASLTVMESGSLEIYGKMNILKDSSFTIYPKSSVTIFNRGGIESHGTVIHHASGLLVNKGFINYNPASKAIIAGSLVSEKSGRILVDTELTITANGIVSTDGVFTVSENGVVKNNGTFITQEDSRYERLGGFINSSIAIFTDYRTYVPPVVLDPDKTTADILINEPETEILGIDVSFWQADIDWDKVAASGIKFAIIRAGHGRVSDERGMFEDSFFRKNAQGAIAAGIDIGVYFYSTARDTSESRAEARFLLDIIKDFEITYPIVFDIEDPMHERMSKEQITDITEAFLKVIAESGYYPMIYSFKNFLENKIDKRLLDKYAVWLAQWAHSPTYENDFYIWQYSATGRVSGINGDVDLNISYRDFAEILRKHGLNKLR